MMSVRLAEGMRETGSYIKCWFEISREKDL
jgi:hypothetical protein